ncbi:signal peptidase II [Candidatus Woesearchaeota archaeon]|nr:signal peptidase II [Candidatus Woesearchaeota archaeon]
MNKQTIFSSIIIIAFIIDQISKYIIKSILNPGQEIDLISWFSIKNVTNTGIAFSFFQNWSSIILITAITIVLVLLYYRKEFFHTSITTTSLGLIVGGALGNIFDRILYCKVIDFIAFSFFPTFNLADTAISIGAILLIFHYWEHRS